MLCFMKRLDKHDLAQMNRDYFQSLEKERLVEVATNLDQKCDRAMGKAATELQK